jgi:hypothetical protein
MNPDFTAAPETVASACEIATLAPPAEAILAGALFGEAATTINRLLANPSEGAFRMGARAMRDAIEARGKDLVAERVAAKQPASGTEYIEASMQFACETPIPDFPALPAQTPAAEWAWWAGTDDEWYQVGPCKTRENALEMFRHDYGPEQGCYLIEAARGRVSFSAEDVISTQYFEDNEGFDYDHTEPDRIGGADVIAAADAELQALLNRWSARWQHTFITPNMFAGTRNAEVVPGECLDCGQDCGEACPADPANAGAEP